MRSSKKRWRLRKHSRRPRRTARHHRTARAAHHRRTEPVATGKSAQIGARRDPRARVELQGAPGTRHAGTGGVRSISAEKDAGAFVTDRQKRLAEVYACKGLVAPVR